MRTVGNRNEPHSGVVLLLAVACLGVVSVVLVIALRQAAQDRRRLEAAAHRLQCDWLLEAGFDRAAAQWAADPNYAGEVWQIEPEELDGAGSARVTIQLDALAAPGRRRNARVAVEFPLAALRIVRLQKERELSRAEAKP